MKYIKENYRQSTQLECETCGGIDFKFNNDKSYIKCNGCNREYLGGYDELVEFNKRLIEIQVNQMKEEVAKDVRAEMNEMIRNIFNK